MKRLAALGLIFAASVAYAQPPIAAYKGWKPPVANLAALPASGNTTGDTRIALDSFVHYTWDGNSWETAASGGGGVSDGDKGDITVASSGTVWTLDAGAVSADELDEAGVEAGLEAVLDLSDIQGAVTDGQVPDSITVTLAATATAFAANPADCAANEFAIAAAASGALTCAAIADADVPDTITASNYVLVTNAGQQSVTSTGAGNDVSLIASDAVILTAAGALDVNAASVDWDISSGSGETMFFDVDTSSDTFITAEFVTSASVQSNLSLRTNNSVDAGFARIQIDGQPGDVSSIVLMAKPALSNGGTVHLETTQVGIGVGSDDEWVLGADYTNWYDVRYYPPSADPPYTCDGGDPLGFYIDTTANESCYCNATEWACGSSGGGLGGTTGATDDAILIADGTGGSTVAASAATLTAAGTLTIPSGQAVRAADGTKGAPALTFGSGDTDTGLYQRADGFIMFSANGTEVGFVGGGATHGWVAPNGIGFSSSTEASGPDVGLTRHVTGILRVTGNGNNVAPLLHSIAVEANTAGSGAPNVLTANESLAAMTNEGATAQNYHTLPTAVAGYEFTFCVQDADGMRIVASAGDTIRVLDKVTASGGYIESTTIGSCWTGLSINATEWFTQRIHGVFTDGTFTFDDTGNTSP